MGWKYDALQRSLFLHRVFAKKYKLKIDIFPQTCKINRTMVYDTITEPNVEDYDKYNDYSRYRTLELVAELINNAKVQGNLAEAGVYEGDFAFMVNCCFPERTLYLYDTFEGFDHKDVNYERDNSYTSQDWFKTEIFGRGNPEDKIKSVLRKMKYPEKCIIRKGYFPETALDERNQIFAFVSLDMDLYLPIFAGLDFFYPRLADGGYIFLHDYNSSNFFGIKKAVEEIEAKYGKLHKFPLSDQGGTLIISK